MSAMQLKDVAANIPPSSILGSTQYGSGMPTHRKHLVFLYSDRQFFTSVQFQTGDFPCTPGLARGGVRKSNFCLCLLRGSSPLGVPIYGRRISYYMLHLICPGVNLTPVHCAFLPSPRPGPVWANVFRAKSDSVLNLPLVHQVFPMLA